MGLWEQLTQYLWNFIIMYVASGGMFLCLNMTAWGVFWGDDDGLMGNDCFKMWGGFSVSFPVAYKFVQGVTLN